MLNPIIAARPPSQLSSTARYAERSCDLQGFEIATKIAYQNGALRGTPKGKRRDCREVTDADVLPTGYAAVARKIADRRMILTGYRLADLLQRISANSVP